MSLTPYQILAPAVCLIAIAYAWSLVFRQRKTVWEAMLWTFFWGFIAYIAVDQRAVGYLSALTGIKNRENAVLVTFLGILLFAVFYLVVRLEELEQRMTRIVRKMALRDADLEGKVSSDQRSSSKN